MTEVCSHIVLVEDELSDATFMRKAFERGAMQHEVVVAETAAKFFAYVETSFVENRPPDLVLLDLSLPAMSGFDVLRALRSGDQWPLVPVIVLTSSSYRLEIAEAYAAGANAFVTKPARLADLDNFVAQIEAFWLGTAHLPYR